MEKTKPVVRGLYLRQMNTEGTEVEGLGFMKVCFHSQNRVKNLCVFTS